MENYYAHVIYNNHGVYEYEYFIRDTNVDMFTKDILSSLESNYNEIYGGEELSVIDLDGWQDFLEENEIEYDSDGGFSYEASWNIIHENC